MPEEEKRRGPGAARPALLTALLALTLALTFALLSVKGSEERPAEDVRWQFAPGQILCIGDSLTAGSCFGSDLQGSSIELSADGPLRPPYSVYFQGGLTWYHAKLGILLSLQKLLDAGLTALPDA